MREHREINLWPDTPIPPAVECVEDLPPPPEDALLERMAKRVRVVYVLCHRDATGNYSYGKKHMASWDGGEDKFGVKHRSVWAKVAQFLLAMKADPMEFIRAQFHGNRIPGAKAPAPNYLMSNAAVERWEEYKLHAVAAVRRQLCSDMNAIRNGVQPMIVVLKLSRQAAYQYALRDRGVSASALYRYIVSLREGLVEDSASFHDAALLQYVFQCDLYDAEWGDVVPATLHTEARKLRSLLGCA